MSIFTKKLADWTLVDCIKMTIGTIAVGYTAEKIYETFQERQKVNDNCNDTFDDDIYVQEEEVPE